MAGGKRPGAGRKKGAQNKITREVKEMILGALAAQKGGGEGYLKRQATKNPAAFMNLLGKIIPSEIKSQVSGENGGPIRISVEFVSAAAGSVPLPVAAKS